MRHCPIVGDGWAGPPKPSVQSGDTAKETALLQAGENNPEAPEDLRTYLYLCSMRSQQVVLHDMLEKRYSLRPYGWPEDEVLLLLARLIVLGEVNLMMDASLLAIDKIYETITTPAKRRKVVVRKRETADPKSIQDARSLGKDLFVKSMEGVQGAPEISIKGNNIYEGPRNVEWLLAAGILLRQFGPDDDE